MGRDFKCITVPLDAAPVRAIRAEPGLWDIADDYQPFARWWPDDVLPDIAQQLVAVVPEGTRWNHDFFGSRNFDQAEYLLDPKGNRRRRTWPEREKSPSYQAVFGAQRFAEHTSIGHGSSWRCSTAAQLNEAVRLIDQLDVAAARREFSVAEMCELGLYKVHASDNDDESFDRTLLDLRTWADYCRAVAAQDLDLVMTMS